PLIRGWRPSKSAEKALVRRAILRFIPTNSNLIGQSISPACAVPARPSPIRVDGLSRARGAPPAAPGRLDPQRVAWFQAALGLRGQLLGRAVGPAQHVPPWGPRTAAGRSARRDPSALRQPR